MLGIKTDLTPFAWGKDWSDKPGCLKWRTSSTRYTRGGMQRWESKKRLHRLGK